VEFQLAALKSGDFRAPLILSAGSRVQWKNKDWKQDFYRILSIQLTCKSAGFIN
jgi:hypothetical protein